MRSVDFYRAALKHPNLQAFLRVIREGESSQEDDAYRMMFGGELFDAPPWEHPRRLHHANGYSSTAAGAYQFLSRTWDEVDRELTLNGDFSQESQDIAAAALIDRRGSLDEVLYGSIDYAIRKCNREWASLPGSPYGQPTMGYAKAFHVYQKWGGDLDPVLKIIADSVAFYGGGE